MPALNVPDNTLPMDETETAGTSAETEETKSEEPAPKKPIEVVALRAGFFGSMRRAEGDKFMISSMDQLGSWMKLADPKAEKARQDELKKQKAGK